MYVIGIDLSGPASSQHTGVAVLDASSKELHYHAKACDGSDAGIGELVHSVAQDQPVIVGLDAPLSYEPGGGQRARDADLRELIVASGLHPGSVMAPLAPRMAYLTLRGHAVARALEGLCTLHPVRIVEVHPGAALRLRGADTDLVRNFASQDAARVELLNWMRANYVSDLPLTEACSSHLVAAYAGALAAYDWALGRPKWVAAAEPPWHPFAFAA